jgi:hypothetical protein
MKLSRVLLVIVLVACGGGEVIGVPTVPTIPMCDDVPTITAEPGAYRDRPVYVGNEMPIDAVRDWASSQPGFETLWIDRDHNGWVTVAFSEDVDARRGELTDLFGDAGVVVVEVDWKMENLLALQQSVVGRFEPGFVQSTGVFENRGVVSIGIGPLSDDRIAQVSEEFAGEPVCLEGIDPAFVPEPGPQPQAGDGWRLLADEKTGQAYRTGLATQQSDFEELWREAGITSPVPEVDFESEIVIWFGAVYGSSCPNLRMDDVVVDSGVVYPIIVDVDASMACTADALPHAYIVAMDRSVFPDDGFVIRLQAEEPFPGVVDQQTWVGGDVTIRGSYVAGVREELPSDPGLPSVKYGGVIEPGYPWSYELYTHCGVEWLGEINGVQWRAESVDGSLDHLPEEWRDEVGDDQYLTVEIVLHEGDPPVLEAAAAGHVLRYLPAAEDPPGCD